MNKFLKAHASEAFALFTVFTLTVGPVTPAFAFEGGEIGAPEEVVAVSPEVVTSVTANACTDSCSIDEGPVTITDIEVTPVPGPITDIDDDGDNGDGGEIVVVVDSLVTIGGGSALPILPVNPIEALPGSISGKIFNDADEDGAFDVGEVGLEAWTVELRNDSQVVVASVATNANGKYYFSDVTPGTYTVDAVMAGVEWSQSFPLGGMPQAVNMGVNDGFLGLDFGVVKLATVSGYVWYDLNNNGAWDANEPPLAGRTLEAHEIVLPTGPVGGVGGGTISLGGDGGFSFHGGTALPTDPQSPVGGTLKSTITDGAGYYTFTFASSELGDWTIKENIPTEWVFTYPMIPTVYTASVSTSGMDIADRNFGNMHLFDVLGMKVAPLSGDPVSTLGALIFTGGAVVLPSGSVIAVPTGTLFTGVNAFDIDTLTAADLLPTDLSGLGSVESKGAVHFGLPGTGLTSDKPLGVTVLVDSALNGETLDIVRSLDGATNWVTDEPETSANCLIASGACTFTTELGGRFAVVKSVSQGPSEPGNDAPSNNGGGGGGGSGSGSITTPIGPDPFNNVPPSGPGVGGGTTGNSVVPEATQLALLTENIGEGTGVQLAGEGTPEGTLPVTPVVEEAPALPTTEGAPAEATEEIPAPGFLANVGSLLTFGTGNMWLGLLSVLIILILLWYAYKSFTKEKKTGPKV